MAFKPFRKIRLAFGADVQEKHINAVQDNVSESLGQLLGRDSLDRTTVDGIVLTPSGVNLVAHTLGRPCSHYVVSFANAPLQVWTASGINHSPKLQLRLMTTATGTVSLECY